MQTRMAPPLSVGLITMLRLVQSERRAARLEGARLECVWGVEVKMVDITPADGIAWLIKEGRSLAGGVDEED